jgi:hypothetical protein
MNIGSTGLLFPYTLGILAYIKRNIHISNYTLTGVSGGTWCSLLYHLEPNIHDHDFLWSILVGDKNKRICLLNRNSMQTFQQNVAKNFELQYKNIDVSTIPLSIIVTHIRNKKLISTKIDKFDDFDDLINFCMCSSYIPFISGKGMYTIYKNNKYIDGEIFRNKQLFAEKSIIVHKDLWDRKYSLSSKFILDFQNSKMLFDQGWNDAKLNSIEKELK